jgi:hypothetical protein
MAVDRIGRFMNAGGFVLQSGFSIGAAGKYHGRCHKGEKCSHEKWD